jgi:hypothetical protein
MFGFGPFPFSTEIIEIGKKKRIIAAKVHAVTDDRSQWFCLAEKTHARASVVSSM